MKTIYTVKLLAGTHHDTRTGTAYVVTPDRTEKAPDGSDKGTLVKGIYPVFKTDLKLWEIFRNKFQQVADDTPVTHPPIITPNPEVNPVPPPAPADEGMVPASVVKELTQLNAEQVTTITTLETAVADGEVLLNIKTSECANLEKQVADLTDQLAKAAKTKANKKG